MIRSRFILIVCLATQFIIAVHPSFVRQFAYADVAGVSQVSCAEQAACGTAACGLSVAYSERPVEVLAAHRIPKHVSSTATFGSAAPLHPFLKIVRDRATRPDPAPAFLAAASRGTFLRHRSLLI